MILVCSRNGLIYSWKNLAAVCSSSIANTILFLHRRSICISKFIPYLFLNSQYRCVGYHKRNTILPVFTWKNKIETHTPILCKILMGVFCPRIEMHFSNGWIFRFFTRFTNVIIFDFQKTRMSIFDLKAKIIVWIRRVRRKKNSHQ